MNGLHKSIWLPKSETKATVKDGKVNIWDEMVFLAKSVAKAPAGFADKK